MGHMQYMVPWNENSYTFHNSSYILYQLIVAKFYSLVDDGT